MLLAVVTARTRAPPRYQFDLLLPCISVTLLPICIPCVYWNTVWLGASGQSPLPAQTYLPPHCSHPFTQHAKLPEHAKRLSFPASCSMQASAITQAMLQPALYFRPITSHSLASQHRTSAAPSRRPTNPPHPSIHTFGCTHTHTHTPTPSHTFSHCSTIPSRLTLPPSPTHCPTTPLQPPNRQVHPSPRGPPSACCRQAPQAGPACRRSPTPDVRAGDPPDEETEAQVRRLVGYGEGCIRMRHLPHKRSVQYAHVRVWGSHEPQQTCKAPAEEGRARARPGRHWRRHMQACVVLAGTPRRTCSGHVAV